MATGLRVANVKCCPFSSFDKLLVEGCKPICIASTRQMNGISNIHPIINHF